jgi:hypothetical protein
MAHEHHEWLSDLNDTIVRAYEREQEMARDPKEIQRVGHRNESEWARVLRRWLPPQYEIGTRKYILLEDEGGGNATDETDLVIFHPSYPHELRSQSSVLAGGLAAAFSVKRKVGRNEIEEACQASLILRRSLRVRKATLRHELVPPIFYGLLAESHAWKSPSSKPFDNVETAITEFEASHLNSPREGLDLICIADLGCWRRVLFVMPMRLQGAHPEMQPGLRLGSFVGSGMFNSDREPGGPVPTLSPLTRFVGALWGKLALNDPTLEPIADGLRATEPSLHGKAGMKNWKLADVVSDDVMDRLEVGPVSGRDWELGYL